MNIPDTITAYRAAAAKLEEALAVTDAGHGRAYVQEAYNLLSAMEAPYSPVEDAVAVLTGSFLWGEEGSMGLRYLIEAVQLRLEADALLLEHVEEKSGRTPPRKIHYEYDTEIGMLVREWAEGVSNG